jgi:hypothetical protein
LALLVAIPAIQQFRRAHYSAAAVFESCAYRSPKTRISMPNIMTLVFSPVQPLLSTVVHRLNVIPR